MPKANEYLLFNNNNLQMESGGAAIPEFFANDAKSDSDDSSVSNSIT